MSTTHDARPQAATQTPPVPLTLEGYAVLHQMMRFRRAEWRKLAASEQAAILAEAQAALEVLEKRTEGQTAVFSMLGHKADLLFVHFRPSFADLNQAELALAGLRLSEYLEITTSYVSIIELGLYESTAKIYKALQDRGLEPHTPEWDAGIQENMDRQREAMRPRLFPEIPPHRYICFYPMDRRRGEDKNWYKVPFEERARQMGEHGMIGRRYAGEVKQIISGSIGLDDWEWGVTLWAEDPVSFKKLIYEMRFDEVSAVYALFGTFYVGLRCPATQLGKFLAGEVPQI
jgi:chlorite dismutase